MPTLQDDDRDLRTEEDQAAQPNDFDPAGEQAYFDQLEQDFGKEIDQNVFGPEDPFDATPDFAPDFKPQLGPEPYHVGAPDKGAFDQENAGPPEDSENTAAQGGGPSIPFNRSEAMGATLAGAGVTGGTLLAMKLAGRFLQRNKKSAVGGSVAIMLVVVIGLFSGSLTLINAKENAEDRLAAATEASAETLTGEMLDNMGKILTWNFLRKARLSANTLRFARTLDARGYSVRDGVLHRPGGAPVTDPAEAKRILKSEFRSTSWGNRARNAHRRNKIIKDMVKRLGMPTDNPVGRSNPVGDDQDSLRNKIKQRLRSMAIGDAADAGEEISKAKRDLGDAIGEDEARAAAGEADELLDNMDAEPRSSTFRMAARAYADQGIERLGRGVTNLADSGVLSKVSGVSEISALVCRVGKAAVVGSSALYIGLRYNLIRAVFGPGLNAAGAQVLGRDADPNFLNEFITLIQTSEGGQSWTSSSGMQWLQGDNSAYPSQRIRDAISVDKKEAGGFMGIILTAMSIGAVKTYCDVATNLYGQAAIAMADLAVQLGAAALTGGTSAGVTQAGVETVERGLTSYIASSMARSFGIAVAAEIGASLGEQFVISRLAATYSSTLTSYVREESGPYMGDLYAAGAGAFFEAAGRSSGMAPLSRAAYLDLQQVARENKREELAQMSLFDRFVGMGTHNTRSLTARSLINSPIALTKPTDIVKSSFLALTDFSSFGSNAQRFASTALSGSAYAQDGEVYTDSNGHVVDPWGNRIVGNDFRGTDVASVMETLEADREIDSQGEPVSGSGLENYINECANKLDILEEGVSTGIKDECEGGKTKQYQTYLAISAIAYSWDAAANPDSESGEDSPAPSVGGSLPTGTAQELAQQILDSNKVSGDSRYISQIQAVAQGDDSCHINPTILGLIASAASQYAIYISSLNRFCTGVLTESGPDSYHYRERGGHAVDIAIVNGTAATGAKPNDISLLNYILPSLPAGSGVGQSNCRSTPLSLPPEITEFSDTCNHIHLQVPVQ